MTTIEKLLKEGDISTYEEIAAEIKGDLIEERIKLSRSDFDLVKEEISVLKYLAPRSKSCKNTFKLMALMNLITPLLQVSDYAEEVKKITLELLSHPTSLIRYESLEIISFNLGFTSLANDLLVMAKEILKDEPLEYIRKFLESL